MSDSPASVFVASQLRAAHKSLAGEWLRRLEAVLALAPNEVFPTDRLLDHIPNLIDEIAAYVASPGEGGIAANTSVMVKAAELGELRYKQRASVHQLLREYQILGDVLGQFVEQEVGSASHPIEASDALRAMGRMTQAVRRLEQQTVDTFVMRYMEEIEQRTTQLRGFTRLVSHEIRQPLSVLQTLASMLPTPAGQAEAPKLIEMLGRNVSRLTEVVQRLERLTRLSRAEADLPTEQLVNMSALVADVAEQMTDMAQARDVSIRIAPDLPELVLEPARVELIFVNLIANALKYIHPEKPSRHVHVERVPKASSPTVVVRDNGIGIPQDRLDAIFKQFVRVHPERDAELDAHGLGLGLAIVRECIAACKGSISVESAENVGTTFTLTWPAPIPSA